MKKDNSNIYTPKVKQPEKKVDTVAVKKKVTLEKLENKPKGSYGGKRAGSGRKPLADKAIIELLRSKIKQHGNVEVEVVLKDGERKKLTRIEALLEVLFQEGFIKRNIQSIKEYLDRVMGKSVQPISGAGDEEPPVTFDFVGEARKRLKKYE